MTPFLNDLKCEKCGAQFNDGDAIRLVKIGRVMRTGGLGRFKDGLQLKKHRETYEHDGACPFTVKT